MNYPSSFEPAFPDSDLLAPIAIELLGETAALSNALPSASASAVSAMLRVTNCYYSNLIEGHNTHPADIERAMRAVYVEDASVRALQREARAHIEVQTEVESTLASGRETCSAEFIAGIHREFYRRVPEELRIVRHPDRADRIERVNPGELRKFDVSVGMHVAPPHSEVSTLLDAFAARYATEKLSPLEKLVALPASHHRLLWIHPFGDGNGRVTRLFSLAYARRAGLRGEGMWSIARGLARRRGEYYALLSAADSVRRYDSDGRGTLSLEALNAFCSFFIEIALDQVIFMRELLSLEKLGERLVAYAELREKHIAPPPEDGEDEPFRAASGLLLREVFLRGEIRRGDAARITGASPAWSRKMLGTLLREKLLVSASPKGPVRISFPAHANNYLFPSLFPDNPGPTRIES